MISLALTFAVGAFTWTLLEYVIHRWLGHHRRLRGNPFGVEHTRHHAEGNYFAATVKKLGVAAVVAVVLGGPAVLIAGAHGGAAIVGFLAMYGAYEVLHRREHTHARHRRLRPVGAPASLPSSLRRPAHQPRRHLAAVGSGVRDLPAARRDPGAREAVHALAPRRRRRGAPRARRALPAAAGPGLSAHSAMAMRIARCPPP
jgi:hypothetical protein